MKILVAGNFAKWLVNFRGGLLASLVAKGHDVYACAPDASDSVKTFLNEAGIVYLDIPLNRDKLNPAKELETFLAFVRLFQRIKPDLYLGYTVKPVIYGCLAAWLTGVPRIFSMVEGLGSAFSGTGERSGRFLRLVITVLYALSLRTCRRVFFLNRADYDFFYNNRMLSSRKKGILLNGIGVNLSFFSPRSYREKGRINFLFAARLIYEKGIAAYVECARRLKKKHKHIRCFVAGWIDENPSAISEEILDQWINEGNIEYLGMLDDIRPAMARSLVLVLPTYYREGLPRSILEAMAMGRAVVTTGIPGCSDAVEDGLNGFLVEPGNVDMLAERMERFILDMDLAFRMGEKGRRKAAALFDEKRVNAFMMGVMEAR